jgi:hypothetical protein
MEKWGVIYLRARAGRDGGEVGVDPACGVERKAGFVLEIELRAVIDPTRGLFMASWQRFTNYERRSCSRVVVPRIGLSSGNATLIDYLVNIPPPSRPRSLALVPSPSTR